MSWDPDAPLSPRPTELDSSSDSPVHDDVVVISDDDSPTSTIPGESVLPLAPHGAVSSGARAPAPPLISNESVAPYRHLNRMDEAKPLLGVGGTWDVLATTLGLRIE